MKTLTLEVLKNLDKNIFKETIKTYDEAGKGRKYCPNCKKYVGARQYTCACGHKFIKGQTAKAKVPITAQQVNLLGYLTGVKADKWDLIVYTPNGECPIKISATDKDSVYCWCDTMLSLGRDISYIYTPDALKYWVKYSYPVFSKEWEVSRELVNDWADSVSIDVSDKVNKDELV